MEQNAPGRWQVRRVLQVPLIRTLMQLECASLVPVLMLCIAVKQCYGKRRRDLELAVQIDNLRGLLGIRRLDRFPNAYIRDMQSEGSPR